MNLSRASRPGPKGESTTATVSRRAVSAGSITKNHSGRVERMIALVFLFGCIVGACFGAAVMGLLQMDAEIERREAEQGR